MPFRCPDHTLSRLHTGVRLAGDPVDNDPRARFFWPPPQIEPGAREGLGRVTTPGSRRSCPGWAAALFHEF